MSKAVVNIKYLLIKFFMNHYVDIIIRSVQEEIR